MSVNCVAHHLKASFIDHRTKAAELNLLHMFERSTSLGRQNMSTLECVTIYVTKSSAQHTMIRD